jgi:WD40 repeat protein
VKSAFVSYSRSNAELAFSLAAEIGLFGYDVWIDREIMGGQDWWGEILAAIQKCDVFIFCISAASLSSEICRLEFDYAVDLGKPVLPVALEEMEVVHPILVDRHIISFLDLDFKYREAISKALVAIPKSFPTPNPSLKPPSLPALPLFEISKRLRTAILSIEEQEDILRSLTVLLSKRTHVAEVRILAAEFRMHASVALRVAEKLDRILKVSPASISLERMDLELNWAVDLPAPAAVLSGRDDGLSILVACDNGVCLEYQSEGGETQRVRDLDMSVHSLRVSTDTGILSVAGRKKIQIRSYLATRDPFGNIYEHVVGMGRIIGLDDSYNGYDVDLVEQEDAGTGKDPEAYRNRNVTFSVAGPTGQLVKPVPTFRSVALDPFSTQAVFGLDDGTLLFWCLRWQRPIDRVTLPNADSIRVLQFVGETLFAGDYKGNLFRIDKELTIVRSETRRQSPICALLHDPNTDTIISVSIGGEFSRHRTNDLAELVAKQLSRRSVAADYPGYGDLIIVGHRKGWITLVSLASMKELASFKFLDGPVNAVFWSRNGEWIAAADPSRLVCLRPDIV